jgi:hypothetical protein
MSDKLYKAINNEKIELTKEEIAELEIIKEEGIASAKEVQDQIQAQENLKASAKAKLIAGEPLTEEEADTIVL